MLRIDRRYKSILLVLLLLGAALFAGAAWLSRGVGGDTVFSEEHPLRISEIMSRNLSYPNDDGELCDWIELENASGADFDLSGYRLSDEHSGAKFAFPTGTVIPARSYIVVSCTEEAAGALYAPFSLNRRGGETVVLMNARNFVVDEVTTLQMKKNCSMIRADDGSLTVSATPTPGFPNTEEGYRQYLAWRGEGRALVRLSEVMTSNTLYPDGNGAFCDWVELYNASGEAADISGYGLSDAEGVIKYIFPQGTVLPPDGYLTVACSNELTGEGYAPFALVRRGGETVLLVSPANVIVDRVVTPAMATDLSYALTDGGWVATPGATPGYPNTAEGFAAYQAARGLAVSGAVVTEVMSKNVSCLTDADGDYSDWVELQNRGDGAMTLSGWFLSDDEAEPYKWSLPDVALQPGELLLIFASGKDRREGELHASFRLSAGETLLLTAPWGETVSRVLCGGAEDDCSLVLDDGGAYRPCAAPTPGREG